jgi:hypothetical protein
MRVFKVIQENEIFGAERFNVPFSAFRVVKYVDGFRTGISYQNGH